MVQAVQLTVECRRFRRSEEVLEAYGEWEAPDEQIARYQLSLHDTLCWQDFQHTLPHQACARPMVHGLHILCPLSETCMFQHYSPSGMDYKGLVPHMYIRA